MIWYLVEQMTFTVFMKGMKTGYRQRAYPVKQNRRIRNTLATTARFSNIQRSVGGKSWQVCGALTGVTNSLSRNARYRCSKWISALREKLNHGQKITILNRYTVSWADCLYIQHSNTNRLLTENDCLLGRCAM